ncbi:MAG: PmoA family protein [Candidatus Hydrogenedentes bacterium]|nr:PmoA family protein [Candidatus Hydrogenedentota bacterium]
MSKTFMTISIAALLFVALGAAADLNGSRILLKSGEQDGVNVPVEIAVETDEAPAMISVVCSDTGKKYPATLRNGKLTFLMDTLPANTEKTLSIVVSERPKDSAPRVLISKQSDEDILDVLIDGVHFTSYHYGSQWRKPFLWPLNSEGGIGVTRDYPMDRKSTPKFARDHPHHKSFWSAYGKVNGTDFWGEGSSAGNQISGEVTFGSGDGYGWIRAANVWKDKDGNPKINENREYRFYATPENARIFDASVTFSAEYGEVLFSDTKEGGIVSVRMHPDLCYTHAIITNALGDVGEANTWGKPSPWCDYSGELPEAGTRGITIFDHPGNLRHPSSWHVRKYGLMGANAFGYSHFSGKEYNKGLMPENGDYTIAANDTLTFTYRMYVHTGNVEEADTAGRYADYAAPPKVSLDK